MPESESEFTVAALKMLRAKQHSVKGAHRLLLGREHLAARESSAVTASRCCGAKGGTCMGDKQMDRC